MWFSDTESQHSLSESSLFIFSQSENDSIDSIKTGTGSDTFPDHITYDDLHEPGVVKASSYPGGVARSSTPKPAEQKTCARSHSTDSQVSLSLVSVCMCVVFFFYVTL